MTHISIYILYSITDKIPKILLHIIIYTQDMRNQHYQLELLNTGIQQEMVHFNIMLHRLSQKLASKNLKGVKEEGIPRITIYYLMQMKLKQPITEENITY
ncbi:unnamed protein product (macronuclear) [Paramecium tetraurelia]|uniref:Uncharacterized protein n=1 Tax=Paramecium tetraurelia TaxID=5888 RepID=A0C675_PARTE|nr:uncharacterized protein GSPATT00035421001 [Paramecium tetraurelia]CAK66292.1 unnamed protein product [Paramecium tetraurelia]|eukprot:XP_001433689.1 hypothetical protein (macronuclear) [Paramecium tetraurelia strain d4-2]